jgi:hypothetical protein
MSYQTSIEWDVTTGLILSFAFFFGLAVFLAFLSK